MAQQAMTKPRGEKTQRYVFYLGLLLAAVAAVLVFIAINSADGGTGAGDVPVVVAAEAIPAQTRLTADHLRVEFVSPDAAIEDAFTSRGQLVDRVVTADVEAGAQIVPSMVSDVAGDGLTFKVEPGTRAISVEVREVVTAGGNIKPGDKVDVIGVFEVESVEVANDVLAQFGTSHVITEPPLAAAPSVGDEEEQPVKSFVLTVTLLQNVKVLGLAQTLTPTTAGGTLAEEVEEADSEPRASTATLQVTPAQAQMLTTADEYGILRMDARAVGDEAAVDVPPTLLGVDEAR